MRRLVTGEECKFKGRPIARGVAFGYAYVDEVLPTKPLPVVLGSGGVAREIERLKIAIGRVRHHLEDHIRDFHAPHDEDLEQVMAAHLLILDDKHFFQKIIDRIENESMPAERAVEGTFCAFADRLAGLRDTYLRARAEDLRDICHTVCDALQRGEEGFRFPVALDHETVFVASHLHPSAVLRARRANAVAFITSSSSYSSHGALMLRACGIPSVGEIAHSSTPIEEETPLLVDAMTGEVTTHPTEATRKAAFQRFADVQVERGNKQQPPLRATTSDGTDINLWANIDSVEQVGLCLDYRLWGIGLFRTEFLVLAQGYAPTEDDQYDVYRDVVRRLGGQPLVLRTFDLGGDKITRGLRCDTADNPSLGLRGVRRHLFCDPHELRAQLRAILRATADCDASVLLPMVTHVDDIRQVREHLDSVCGELEKEGAVFNRSLKVGAMIEIPAAALSLAEILGDVDFVCIGTNDLSQYLSAADRNNMDVTSYLAPEKSGLFTFLKVAVEQARSLGRVDDVLVGGELVSNPDAAQEFVRLGIRNLVVVPRAAPAVRKAIAATAFPIQHQAVCLRSIEE